MPIFAPPIQNTSKNIHPMLQTRNKILAKKHRTRNSIIILTEAASIVTGSSPAMWFVAILILFVASCKWDHTAISSSLSCRVMGTSSANSIPRLIDGALAVIFFRPGLLLLYFPAGISWLCFPSYEVMTAFGSAEDLSMCFRTLHPA